MQIAECPEAGLGLPEGAAALGRPEQCRRRTGGLAPGGAAEDGGESRRVRAGEGEGRPEGRGPRGDGEAGDGRLGRRSRT